MARLGRWIVAGVIAGVVTTAARRGLAARPPGGAGRWTRENHRGEPISLLEGPAVACGLLAGAVAGTRGQVRFAHAVAVVGAAVFGAVDDLAEDTSSRSKGLRGHLGAALRGELTTGGLKVLGIGCSALLAAAAAPSEKATWLRRGVDVVADGALIAAAANVVNLLDLRPGRALKASSAAASLLVLSGAGTSAAAVLGSAAAAAAADLGEQDMLGDCGANALGALVGAAVVTSAPRPARRLVLVGLVGLTLASERVSFSKVIDATPWLHAADLWGRRPTGPVRPACEDVAHETSAPENAAG